MMRTVLRGSLRFPMFVALVLGVVMPAGSATVADQGLQIVAELKAPGIETELAGVYPHPERDDLYLVVANQNPPYRAGQDAKLPEQYRGRLLTVNGDGEVISATDLVAGDYGGLTANEGYLFVSSLEPAEILKVDLATAEVVARFPVGGPIGGLEYDPERQVLLAQMFIGHPQLAVIDPDTGEQVQALWSDESAMGLASVGGDLLCTWADGFHAEAFAELRLLDPSSGSIVGRVALDEVHTSLAPTDDGFLSLVATGDGSGEVVVRRYRYDSAAMSW